MCSAVRCEEASAPWCSVSNSEKFRMQDILPSLTVTVSYRRYYCIHYSTLSTPRHAVAWLCNMGALPGSTMYSRPALLENEYTLLTPNKQAGQCRCVQCACIAAIRPATSRPHRRAQARVANHGAAGTR